MSEFVEFENRSDNEEEETQSIPPKGKKSRKNLAWVKIMEFGDAVSAVKNVDDDMTWKKITSYSTQEGRKVVYRCTGGQYRKLECPARISLLYHAECSRVTLFKTKDGHSYHQDADRGLPYQSRALVEELFLDGIRRPNAIIAAFQSRGVKEPEKSKLNNFLAKLRIKHFGQLTISLNSVLCWCQERNEIPTEEDKPFVLGVPTSFDDNPELRIVFSTKRLLGNVQKSKGVQADATYKLNWHGYPVLIVGSSDFRQVFHPFGIAVTSNEMEADFAFIFYCIKSICLEINGTEWEPKILLADASNAITNGFKTVFGPSFRRLMCYSHVVKNIDTKLRGLEEGKDLTKDIECLHLCGDDETFTVVSNLFIQKWSESNNTKVKDFVQYFQSTWLTDHKYWYVGARAYFPITNNGLEATIGTLKNEGTMRERLPVEQFLSLLEHSILRKWSLERDPQNPNFKPFCMKPEYDTQIWTDANNWAKLNMKILSKNEENISQYYFSSSMARLSNIDISPEIINAHEAAHLQWTSFDRYKSEFCNRFWVVTVVMVDEVRASCTCPVYLKKYACKHSLGMLIRLRKVKVPLEVLNIPLGEKRKRGRPSKAKKALLIQ